jgi:hypothetical protein
LPVNQWIRTTRVVRKVHILLYVLLLDSTYIYQILPANTYECNKQTYEKVFSCDEYYDTYTDCHRVLWQRHKRQMNVTFYLLLKIAPMPCSQVSDVGWQFGGKQLCTNPEWNQILKVKHQCVVLTNLRNFSHVILTKILEKQSFGVCYFINYTVLPASKFVVPFKHKLSWTISGWLSFGNKCASLRWCHISTDTTFYNMLLLSPWNWRRFCYTNVTHHRWV